MKHAFLFLIGILALVAGCTTVEGDMNVTYNCGNGSRDVSGCAIVVSPQASLIP